MLYYVNSLLNGTFIPLILFASGLYYSARLGFFNLLHPIKIIRAYFDKSGAGKGISPFRAVTVALAGTLGVGNIAGVATAIAAGGAGAVFWMWASAAVAAVLKYAEVLLGIYYRRERRGGAAYYILRGLGNRKLALVFSGLLLVSSFAMGNIIQVKAVCDSFRETLGIGGIAVSFMIALPVVLVVKGGIKKISSFTVALIPILCIGYIGLSLYVIVTESGRLPEVFSLIFRSAFSLRSFGSGLGGYAFARAIRYGVARGIASNEAGCGTAPTAHASADTDCAVRQGFWGIFEVFADTVVLCTLTALVILLAFGNDTPSDGMALAIAAFEKYAGSSAGIILSLAVYFFALSTVICWYHYGTEALFFITKGRYENAYFVSYLVLIFVSCYIPSLPAWELSDLTFGAMTAVNVYALIRLRRVVVIETRNYFNKCDKCDRKSDNDSGIPRIRPG
ncbi:MAG: sodium:alanine symporter family protein [Clostridia bacterium]|nr:sodium:alanine symporter family protein [Clostridia bacterium]